MPWVVARFPAQTGLETPVWSGPLSAVLPQTLLDSPARREIASRLSRGDTAVWLLLESGDHDEEVERLLETESRKLEHTLKLPESLPDDPQMDLNFPLRIAFSTVRVNRLAPAERLLVNQLLNCDPHLKNISQTMLFPIYGRGRVLPPAIGESIRPQAIEAMAKLLTGPCSCQLKEMNPGYDLLLAANWSALIDNSVAPGSPLPPLTGLSQMAALPANLKAATHSPTNAATIPAVSGGLKRNLLGVLALGALALAGGTFILRQKTGIRQ